MFRENEYLNGERIYQMNKFQIQGAVLVAIFDRESGLSCNVWICNESFCLQTSSFKEL